MAASSASAATSRNWSDGPSSMAPAPDDEWDILGQGAEGAGDIQHMLVDRHFFNDFPDAFAKVPETLEQHRAKKAEQQEK